MALQIGRLPFCRDGGGKDGRIVILNQENAGPSSARNEGLKIAKGEYICFVDSDDWIEKDAIEKMQKCMQDYGSDMVICDMVIYYGESRQDVKPSGFRVMDNAEAMKSHLDKSYVCNNSVCNKLIKKDALEGLYFEVGKYYEDTYYMHHLISRCSKIVNIGIPLYYHNQHEGSITHLKVSPKSYHLVEAYVDKLAYIQDHYPEFTTYAQAKLIRASLDYINNVLHSKGSDNQLITQKNKAYRIIKQMPLLKVTRCEDTVMNRKLTLQFALIKLSPSLYERIYYINLR